MGSSPQELSSSKCHLHQSWETDVKEDNSNDSREMIFSSSLPLLSTHSMILNSSKCGLHLSFM